MRGGPGIFSPARRTAAQLLRAARERRVPSQVERLAAEGGGRAADLDFLEKALFAHAPGLEREPEGAVELFAARTPRGEVEWTAARILEPVREEGLRFRDIGVCSPGPRRTYEDLMETRVRPVRRAGVPVHRLPSVLLDKPVLALVTVGAGRRRRGDYAYDDAVPLSQDRPHRPGGGGAGSAGELCPEVGHPGRAGGRRRSPGPCTPEGYGLPMAEEDQALLERVDRARRRVAAPLERLRKNSARTGRGQAMALYGFLEEIGLPRRLGERVEELRRRGEPALAEEYRQLWEILCGGAGAVRRRSLGEVPMELEEFSQSVPAGALSVRRGHYPGLPGPGDSGGNHPADRPPGCKVLFLLGADDSSIPQVGAEPGLLSDDDRTLLASYGLELDHERGGAPLPGDDHPVSDLRPAQPASDSHLARARGRGGGAAALLPGGAAEAALPRPCRGAGGGTGRTPSAWRPPCPPWSWRGGARQSGG